MMQVFGFILVNIYLFVEAGRVTFNVALLFAFFTSTYGTYVKSTGWAPMETAG